MEKGKVDMELIRRYIRGELTPREMYTLERQAQADPMLMDVILGMEQEALGEHDDNLADIRKRIGERIGRRRTIVRSLAPAQRWAIAASLLAVLTVGAWWFVREDTLEQQREATVAAVPEEITDAEAKSSQEPIPPTNEREPDTAPQAARIASTDVATADLAEKQEKKEVRLARVTPKADTDADLLDSVVVVGFGTQPKAKIVGAAARIAAAEMDSPVVAGAQARASHTEHIRIRGISAAQQTGEPLLTDSTRTEDNGKPVPRDGWIAYREYLKNAVKLAPGKRGTVDLTFTVDDTGRPTDVKVVETSNVELNKFATLIVRDGPRWLPGANDERKVTLRVAFK
ncbi:energy transducer TonB [Parapedobacter sp. 10938]|uniref:energy transducer TonB n=1 Tax=Parapedobacter flavus TaxID=3110225 RepID=UPI002DB74704|nr:energy transducer TonB [Parapedobacter sp. 10938]MEC3880908.1 energy transducer TonB [Parapedobacter sp. 10938]